MTTQNGPPEVSGGPFWLTGGDYGVPTPVTLLQVAVHASV